MRNIQFSRRCAGALAVLVVVVLGACFTNRLHAQHDTSSVTSERGTPVAIAWKTDAPKFLYALKDQSGAAQAVEKISLNPITSTPTERLATDLQCRRIHAARAGKLACFTQVNPKGLANAGKLSAPMVHVYSPDLRLIHSHAAPGATPSRVQLSADGVMLGFTTFTTGSSYGGSAGVSFATSTRVGLADDPRSVGDINKWPLRLNDKLVSSPNSQFWGVTFSPLDSNVFYVTVYINDARHIARGRFKQRDLEIIFTGAECPSVSPDGLMLAVKKQVAKNQWRPAMLALASLKLSVFDVAEFTDDQIAWYSPAAIMFQMPDPSSFFGTQFNTYTLDIRNGHDSPPHKLLADSRSAVPVFGDVPAK